MAIRMVHITREHAMEHDVSMKLRVGINSGPVVAGVIGKSKYIYDLWGDTVNLASRMESGGVPDAVQVTRAVYERLKDQFVFEPRGAIEVKGKGEVEAWLLRIVEPRHRLDRARSPRTNALDALMRHGFELRQVERLDPFHAALGANINIFGLDRSRVGRIRPSMTKTRPGKPSSW